MVICLWPAVRMIVLRMWLIELFEFSWNVGYCSKGNSAYALSFLLPHPLKQASASRAVVLAATHSCAFTGWIIILASVECSITVKQYNLNLLLQKAPRCIFGTKLQIYAEALFFFFAAFLTYPQQAHLQGFVRHEKEPASRQPWPSRRSLGPLVHERSYVLTCAARLPGDSLFSIHGILTFSTWRKLGALDMLLKKQGGSRFCQ